MLSGKDRKQLMHSYSQLTYLMFKDMLFVIIAFSTAVLWWYGCVDVLHVGGRQVIVKMIDIYTDFHEPPPLHRCCAAPPQHCAVTMCSYLILFLQHRMCADLIWHVFIAF